MTARWLRLKGTAPAGGRADLACAVVRSVPVPVAADGGRYYPSRTLEHPVSTREYPSSALLQPTAAASTAARGPERKPNRVGAAAALVGYSMGTLWVLWGYCGDSSGA